MEERRRAKISLNVKRGMGLYRILLDAQSKKLDPFNQPPMQGDHSIPPSIQWGSIEHQWLIFAWCLYMKGGIASLTAMSAMYRLYEQNPEIFRPARFVHMGGAMRRKEIRRIHTLLQQTGLGANAREVSRNWVANFRKLGIFWDGCPMALFSEFKTSPKGERWTYREAKANYEKLARRFIRPRHGRKKWNPWKGPYGFYGFGYKMVSMILYFLIEAGFLSSVPYSAPIDSHANRVLVGTKIVFSRDENLEETYFDVDEVAALGREMTLRYAIETGESPERIAEVTWYLSKTFCVRHPDNSSSQGEYRARATIVTPKKYEWNNNRVKVFARTCGRCPVAANCTFAVPSAYFYKKGICVRRRRTFPPEAFPLDLFVGWNPVY